MICHQNLSHKCFPSEIWSIGQFISDSPCSLKYAQMHLNGIILMARSLLSQILGNVTFRFLGLRETCRKNMKGYTGLRHLRLLPAAGVGENIINFLFILEVRAEATESYKAKICVRGAFLLGALEKKPSIKYLSLLLESFHISLTTSFCFQILLSHSSV